MKHNKTEKKYFPGNNNTKGQKVKQKKKVEKEKKFHVKHNKKEKKYFLGNNNTKG